ncbi:hypothetical protein ACRAWF_22390 [Streptomyces sp. L7]
MTLAAPRAEAAGCTTYYVSSASGSDSNDGCTTATPWKTLTNVNATTLAAGNQILFQDGGSSDRRTPAAGLGRERQPDRDLQLRLRRRPILDGGRGRHRLSAQPAVLDDPEPGDHQHGVQRGGPQRHPVAERHDRDPRRHPHPEQQHP